MIVALTVSFVVAAGPPTPPPAVPLPADWAEAAAKSTLLFAPVPSKILPSIENGFIGGDVGCEGGAGGSSGALHLAGLYAGGSSRSESRAGLPNPLAAQPAAALPYRGAALNTSSGLFLERWALRGCGAAAVLESRRYAHRGARALLVWELAVHNATSRCTVNLRGCSKRASGMVALGAPGVYQVSDPEQPADPTVPRRAPSVVAVVSNIPGPSPLAEAEDRGGRGALLAAPPRQWSVEMGPDSPRQLWLAVVRSTLEPGVTNATVRALAQGELARHLSAGAASLAASHAAAWAEVYGVLPAASAAATEAHPSATAATGHGGIIELEGNSQLSAQVHSSLYYLLSSVRADWPHGISEGGIASQAYRGMSFWSDGVMDGPLLAAINAPVADALLRYRSERLGAAKSIARMNGYAGAFWPWQSAVTGFERSCGNVSIAMKVPPQNPRVGCYWMHEVHISCDVALFYRLNYYRSGRNESFLREVSPFLAWIGSPCLRHCVHGASTGGLACRVGDRGFSCLARETFLASLQEFYAAERHWPR
jgi:hypothetical protein